jgi:hypothetical protein
LFLSFVSLPYRPPGRHSDTTALSLLLACAGSRFAHGPGEQAAKPLSCPGGGK